MHNSQPPLSAKAERVFCPTYQPSLGGATWFKQLYCTVQAENDELSKVGKTMAEEKELLEHTALKVKSDLEEMRGRYQETVSAINALTANPSLLSLSLVEDTTGPAGGGGGGGGGLNPADPSSTTHHQQELSQASVSELRKLNQLTSAQEEKTAAKLRAKLEELNRTKQELQQKIRYIQYPVQNFHLI